MRRKADEQENYVLMTRSFKGYTVTLPKDAIIVSYFRDKNDSYGNPTLRLTFLTASNKSEKEVEQQIKTTELLPEPETIKDTKD